MITNEAEIRVALQAVLVSVLALYGFWGCALVVVFILLPWKPLLAVGTYLAQPVVDWRIRKARERHEKGMMQIERELDAFLESPRDKAPVSVCLGQAVEPTQPPTPPRPAALETAKPDTRPLPAFQGLGSGGQNPPARFAEVPLAVESPKADPGQVPVPKGLTISGNNLSATLAIPPVIKDHVRNLPQGVFSNMDLEVEQVKFQGDKAEAYVKFQSPNVRELVIHQRYVLSRSGEHWQVESRQPSSGSNPLPPYALPTTKQPMRLT